MNKILHCLFTYLSIPNWPVFIRKYLVFIFLKRKKLQSFPFETQVYGFQFKGDAANLIDYHILSRGSFEPGLTRLLQIIFKDEENALFLDVGANVGVHSLGLCPYCSKVFAVEPNENLCHRLEHLIEKNKIKNISLKRYALHDKNEELCFSLPSPSNLGTGKVMDKESEPDLESNFEAQLLRVQGILGDDLLEEALRSHSLRAVKIDVEGHELSVLKGLRKSLLEHRPFIACEILQDSSDYFEAFKSVIPPDYLFLKINRINKRNFSLSKVFGCGDVLLVPVEKIEILNPYLI
jgi:FkbM family methyltransferase